MKPLVSVVNGHKLDVKYFMPEIAVIMRMTRAEINSKDCIPIVNKVSQIILFLAAVLVFTVNKFWALCFPDRIDYERIVFELHGSSSNDIVCYEKRRC